jgi:hypothetical protein
MLLPANGNGGARAVPPVLSAHGLAVFGMEQKKKEKAAPPPAMCQIRKA